MTRRIAKYTNEYKLEAVNLALRSPSISGIAKDLGIPISTLHTWIKALASKTKSSKTNTDEAKDITAIIEENRRLHKVYHSQGGKRYLKKGSGILCSKPKVKYEFIKTNKDEFSIERMCIMLSVERSGYYAWKHRIPCKRELANKKLDKKIFDIYNNNKARYGSPRLTK